MASIKITVFNNDGKLVAESYEKALSLSSAFAIHGSLGNLLQSLAINFRRAEVTGKIPMEPTDLPPAEWRIKHSKNR